MNEGEKYLSHDQLCSRLHYDPETGVFHWKNGKRANKIAGTLHPHGYRRIFIGKYLYYAHRLAWFYVYRSWPTHQIDHINGDRGDSSIRNLRAATSGENSRNRVRRGFELTPTGKFAARIHPPGFEKYIFLGTFETEEEAASAYETASVKYYGEFSPYLSRDNCSLVQHCTVEPIAKTE